MNKVGRIAIDHGNFVSLNFCCFDHGDVTWDCSKGGSFGKQGSFLENKFWKKLGVVGTC